METVSLVFTGILPNVVSLAAVVVSFVAVRQTYKTQMASAYFAAKSGAYDEYLSCVARFVYDPVDESRNALSCSLYRVQLFASDEVCAAASAVYEAAIAHSRSGRKDGTDIDPLINEMRISMRNDLASYGGRAGR